MGLSIRVYRSTREGKREKIENERERKCKRERERRMRRKTGEGKGHCILLGKEGEKVEGDGPKGGNSWRCWAVESSQQ